MIHDHHRAHGVLIFTALLLGCGTDAAAPEGLDATADAGDALDASLDTAVVDATADATADPGDAAPPFCQFPAPRLGSSAAAQALAAAPGRCGQPAYSWLEDADLGTVTATTHVTDFDAAALSALLAAEDAEAPRPLRYDVRVDRITYVTQDRGALIAATALIAYPRAPAPGVRFETLLSLHGSAGFSDACAPSLQLQTAALGAVFASMGYLVVLPDYIGLKAAGEPTGFLQPYLVGRPTAIASLDAVRALGSLPEDAVGGACVSPRVAVIGGSQGGHAALWVDRLAPYYAAELELVGVVATAPPSDLLGQLRLALASLRPGTDNAMHFWGAAAGWYGVADRLSELFVPPFDTALLPAMEADCHGEEGLPELTAPGDAFTPSIIAAAAAGELAAVDPWGCLVTDNGLTTTSVTRLGGDPDSYGVLFVMGEADPLVDPAVERAAFTTLCEAGTPLQYLECAGAGHTQATLWALPEIVDFVEARFAGEPFVGAADCQVSPAVTCRGTR